MKKKKKNKKSSPKSKKTPKTFSEIHKAPKKPVNNGPFVYEVKLVGGPAKFSDQKQSYIEKVKTAFRNFFKRTTG